MTSPFVLATPKLNGFFGARSEVFPIPNYNVMEFIENFKLFVTYRKPLNNYIK